MTTPLFIPMFLVKEAKTPAEKEVAAAEEHLDSAMQRYFYASVELHMTDHKEEEVPAQAQAIRDLECFAESAVLTLLVGWGQIQGAPMDPPKIIKAFRQIMRVAMARVETFLPDIIDGVREAEKRAAQGSSARN